MSVAGQELTVYFVQEQKELTGRKRCMYCGKRAHWAMEITVKEVYEGAKKFNRRNRVWKPAEQRLQEALYHGRPVCRNSECLASHKEALIDSLWDAEDITFEEKA